MADIADGDGTRRDGDYPLVGRTREIELGGESLTVEVVACWLENGQPARLTVEAIESGFRYNIDRETWRAGS